MSSISFGSNLISQSVSSGINNIESGLQKAAMQSATGKRIIKASDDAAGLAVGTALQLNVNTLTTALTASGQANAVLGVADGAAATISNILSQLQSLTVQASMGSSSATERGFFNEAFQQLSQQIQTVVETTTFNNIVLLDGSLAGGGGLVTDTTGASANATSSFTITFGAGNGGAAAVGIFSINGVSFDVGAATSVTGADIVMLDTLTGAQVASLVASLINNTAGGTNTWANMTEQNYERLSDLTASVTGSTLTVTSKRTGIGGRFLVNVGATNTAAYVTNIANTTQSQAVAATTAYTMSSSSSTGQTTGSMGRMSVTASGTFAGSIMQTLSQTNASSGWVTITSANLASGQTVSMFGTTLTLESQVTNTANQILVGATDFETAQNLVTFLNNSNDPNIANYYYQTELLANGTINFKATARAATTAVNGDIFQIGSTASTISAGTAGVSNGLDVSHITDNPGFLGTISGFTASMTGSNSALLSVKVGNYTYQADVLNTAPTANYTVRMKSTSTDGLGGWFDMTLAANNGVTIATQADANTFAADLDAAFAPISFYQQRQIDSFNATGSAIEGTVVSMTSGSFPQGLTINSISLVGSQQTSNQQAQLSITLSDGRTFSNTSLGLGSTAGTEINLTNPLNSNEMISIIWGENVRYDTSTSVTLLQEALNSAFSTTSSGMSFQVGTQSNQTITITLPSVTTSSLFGGKSLDVLTASSAAAAGAQIENAINTLLSLRAQIGSMEIRFNSAAATIQTTIENDNAAKSEYLDADLSESTQELAMQQVLLNAAISVLAQTNSLPQIFLKLLS